MRLQKKKKKSQLSYKDLRELSVSTCVKVKLDRTWSR